MRFSLVLALASSALAAPVPFSFGDFLSDVIGGSDDNNKAATAPISVNDISDFARIAQFTRAAFCTTPVVQKWACGEACDANPQTQPIIAGGDNAETPQFFVAFDPPSNSVVVAHQGTDRKDADSVFNDIDFLFDEADDTIFPGAKKAGAKLHGGFQNTFNRTSRDVLNAVQFGIANLNARNVIVTGHSLGAAIGLLDTVFLAQHLDPSISIKSVTFGLPRTGNKAWANFVDKIVKDRKIDFQFFVNGDDPVPKVPPVALGFQHPSGEIFQRNNAASIETFRCPGQENENCSASISVLDSDSRSHGGPYAGVSLGGKFCKL